MAENDYTVRVFQSDEDDERMTPLQRAMHAELCRIGKNGLHDGLNVPKCYRAMKVAERHFLHDRMAAASEMAARLAGEG